MTSPRSVPRRFVLHKWLLQTAVQLTPRGGRCDRVLRRYACWCARRIALSFLAQSKETA